MKKIENVYSVSKIENGNDDFDIEVDIGLFENIIFSSDALMKIKTKFEELLIDEFTPDCLKMNPENDG